jgi:hypothetical protein
MRGLLILSAIVAIVIFLMPFILSAAFFFIVLIALLLALANFGLLPGVVPRRYGRSRKIRFDEQEPGSGEKQVWRADPQEGAEIITLPETALHKDDSFASDTKKTRKS